VSSVAGAPSHYSDEQPADVGTFDDDEMTRVVEGGALAGAFAAAVAAKPVEVSRTRPSGARDSVPVTADEWFVGVNGVPVGPLRLSEIRSRAQSGAIGTENLVWREGFEEWLPLHKFPELVAIVEDGVSAARASSAPLAPPRELADPFASDAILSASTSAPSGGFAAPSAAATSAPTTSAAATSPSVLSPAPASLQTRPSASVDEPIAPPTRRSGIAPAALFAMVVAVGLGLALGFVMFGGEKTKIVREVVEVPAERGEDAAPPPPAASAEAAAVPVGAAEKSPSGGVARGAQTRNNTSAPAPSAQQGLSGLSGLKGLSSGPQGGPSPDSAVSSGGQPLDSSQVQATVGRYTSSVKRSCWQPALDTRDKDAPTSARVTVSITVGSDGKVRQATTSGDPRGYGGLASCISRRVQTWTFPPSSGTTTVNVPFVFAAQ
jgi:hypothetical protein